jgi:DNA gyrase subunit A
MALGRAYSFGPTFRAEKSKTRRHLSEFWMVEPEMAYAGLDDAMDLAEGDFLVAAEVVEENGLMLSIAENGYGKRTPLKHYRLTRRGGKGVINMKVTPRTGKVVGVLAVADETDVMIITQDGKLIRIEAAAIRQSGRSAQGVRLVKMETSDRVAAACVVTEDEANGKNGNEPTLPLQ